MLEPWTVPIRGGHPIRGYQAGIVPPMPDRPLVVLRPAPHPIDRIFSTDAQARLHRDYEVGLLAGDAADEARLDAALPRAFAIVGQPDLPAERLERAAALRVVMNVEELTPTSTTRRASGPASTSSAAAPPTPRPSPSSRWGSRSTSRAASATRIVPSARAASATSRPAPPTRFCCAGPSIGLVGYGNLGRALHRLLRPFDATIRVFDPRLPTSVLREAGLFAASLDDVLAESQVVFVLATVTAESQRLLGPRELDLLPDGARLVLVSRAAVFDVDAVLDRVPAGRLLAAIDVWPPGADARRQPGRTLDGLVLSPHRGGRHPAGVPRDRRHGARRPRPGAPGPAAGPDAAGGARAGGPLPQPAGGLSPSHVAGPDWEATLIVQTEAIVFDCDGVLIDSDAGAIAAWTAWAVVRDLDPQDVLAICHGQPARSTVNAFVEPDDVDVALAAIDRLEQELTGEARALPGRHRAVGRAPTRSLGPVHVRQPCPRDRPAGRVGDRAAPGFVTADDVARGKPDPEGYALALTLLGADPSRSVVFEDAPNGVAAARAAGVGIVIGVGERAVGTAVDAAVADLREVRWDRGRLLVRGADPLA